jgi:hypothetical protein
VAPEVEHPVVVRDPMQVESYDGVVTVKGWEATLVARGRVAEE